MFSIRSQRFHLTATALAATVVLTACGASTDPADPTVSAAGNPADSAVAGTADSSAAAGAATDGGEIAIGLATDPGCIDPQQTGSLVALNISRALVDSLTDQDPETGEIVPWLAESFDINDAGTEFTFKLRDGVTFSDGSPLTAEVVKANFETLSDPKNSVGGPGASYLIGYQDVTVEDEYTVTISFAEPNAQFLQATATTALGIVSLETTTKTPEERCSAVVGTGAFTLDHYSQNQEAVLAKRTDYAWGSEAWTSQGPAHLDRLTYKFVPEPAVRTGALSSGELQVAADIQPLDQDQFTGNGFQLVTRPNPGIVPPLYLNHEGLLADQNLRLAVLKGIDRQDLVDTLYNERYLPATDILSSTTPGYTDHSDLLAYDPDAAAALLEESGWTVGDGGIRTKDGATLTLTAISGFPQPELEVVQQQLVKIGVDLQIAQSTSDEFLTRQTDGEFDISSWSLTRSDPDVLRTVLYSPGANNFRLPAGDLDGLLEDQLSELDTDARAGIVAEITTKALEQADIVPLYEAAQVHGASDAIADLGLDSSLRLNFHDAYLAG